MTSTETKKRRRGFLGDFWVGVVFMGTFFGLGGFVVWASIVQISEGVTTGGQLVIESRRQTVQHLEGGIIEQIMIRDGDEVRQGQVLMTLTNTDATSRAEQLINIIASRHYELDRLRAQQRGNERVVYTQPDLPAGISLDDADFIDLQNQVFDDQRARVIGDQTVIDAEIESLRADIAGRQGQVRTIESTIALERREEERLAIPVAQQLTPASDLTNVLRRINEAQNQRSLLQLQISTAQARILEAEERKRQVVRAFNAEVSSEISRVRDALLEAREELTAIEDVLKRREISAPITGQVLNLAFTTVGGVVGRGEPILEIVPDDDALFIELQVPLTQRDSVRVGQKVVARFSTLDPVDPPEIDARVVQVDADATTNPDDGSSFYLARVNFEGNEVEDLKQTGDFIAGLPVEVFIDSGITRSPMSYIIQPLSDIFRNALRSE